jgi:hypothetical protein
MDTGQKMKNMVRFIAFFVLSTLLASQSLVDVAKKEQERREKLKGKNVRIVTNADLKTGRKTPAVETPAAQVPGEAAGEPEETEMPEAQGAEGAYDEEAGAPFATGILPDTSLVENPEFALSAPDGQYAEMSIYGILELEFAAKNEAGPDIVVHARIAGLEEMAASQEEGMPAGYMGAMQPGIPPMYGVLVLDDRGVWQAIGKDTGSGSQASFDLGSISSSKRIRIIFQYLDVPNVGIVGARLWRTSDKEITMGIDAVESLH